MARSIRIEYPGALYHVMARGNRREAIYRVNRGQGGNRGNRGQVTFLDTSHPPETAFTGARRIRIGSWSTVALPSRAASSASFAR